MLKNAKKTEDQMKFEIKNFSEKFESSQRQINDQKNDFNSKLEEKELLLDKQIGLLKSTTEDLAKGTNYILEWLTKSSKISSFPDKYLYHIKISMKIFFLSEGRPY